MMSYKTVKQRASAEFTEKKSVFIGYTAPVSGEKQALDFIAEIKKKHPDATHNVYAYILQGTETARFSDDGEPQGTAGMPVLEVAKREGLSGIVIVVTRYFGGILLGAGGLLRAYAKAAKLAIDAAGIALFKPFTEFSLAVRYSDYEKISKELKNYGVKLDNTDFSDSVTLFLAADSEKIQPFFDFVRDYTGNTASVTVIGQRFDCE